MKFFKNINWSIIFFIFSFLLVLSVTVLSIYFHGPVYGVYTSILVCLLGQLAILHTSLKQKNEFIISLKKHLEKIVVVGSYEAVDNIINDNIVKDRIYLLLLMAKSFNNVGKLLIEKKHPNSNYLIFVFQLKNGNIRFSIREDLVPQSIITKTIIINSNKINYKNNYKLIEELLSEGE